MKPEIVLTHVFVESVPDELQEHTLYVSVRFATVIHKCCCGCGRQVVTPLAPSRWHLTFDGRTISLHPSIGNWSMPCRSHYWIKSNRVKWADAWTHGALPKGEGRIAAGAKRPRSAGVDERATSPTEHSRTWREWLWSKIFRRSR